MIGNFEEAGGKADGKPEAVFIDSSLTSREAIMLLQIREHLGAIDISRRMVEDYPPPGLKMLGWFLLPVDLGLVFEFDNFYWGPGSGPRETLEECIEDIFDALMGCGFTVVRGTPGPKKRESD